MWLEFRSRIFIVVQNKLFGISATKIFKISWEFWEEDGQYIGPGGAQTLKQFVITKLCRTTSRG